MNRQFTIKELRARKNLTQTEAAQHLGVSLTTYNLWERDVSRVKLGNAYKMAKLYGVSLDEIFLG